MMKKNGFTLAEVLITLAIIGVVATMTLPALIANTGEQQAKSAFKKSVNTLTEAASLHMAVTGFNFDSLVNSATAPNANDDDQAGNTLVALLRARTAIDYATTKDGKSADIPKLILDPPAEGDKETVPFPTGEDAPNTAVVFRDGTALLYKAEAVFDGTLEGDNMTKGLVVVIDTNGVKGPNYLSNCQGKKKGANEIQTAGYDNVDVDPTVCDDKTKRVINDRFLVRLRGSVAQPEGAAAVWTFQN